MIAEYFKNLFFYFISINANAFWAIIYFLSQNWFLLLSLFCIVILTLTEIKIKSSYIIDDEREML